MHDSASLTGQLYSEMCKRLRQMWEWGIHVTRAALTVGHVRVCFVLMKFSYALMRCLSHVTRARALALRPPDIRDTTRHDTTAPRRREHMLRVNLASVGAHNIDLNSRQP